MVTAGTTTDTGFWGWLLHGCGRKPGYRNVITRALIGHAVIGGFLVCFVAKNGTLASLASSVLFPLAGTLVGLTFAWAGNANALLQTSQVRKITQQLPSGIVEYAFYYQLAILLVLITICAWGMAGLGVLDHLFARSVWARRAGLWMLFTLLSLTIRECWCVVDTTSRLLIARHAVQEAEDRRNSEDIEA